MMGDPGSNPDQNNPRDRGLRNGRQHILVCNDDDDDDDMNKMKIKIIMTMLMKTWLAFTFAVHGIAEGTCKESEKDKCDECDHCKSEKKRNVVNITVVTITVVDTVWSKFTRGAGAATVLPCNIILTIKHSKIDQVQQAFHSHAR